MLIKGNPEAVEAHREIKSKALAKTARARRAADAQKAAHNAGTATAPRKA
jgi:hypothetical protein